MGEVSGRQVYFRLSPAEDQAMWQAFRDGNATAALNQILVTHVAREHHAGQAERAEAWDEGFEHARVLLDAVLVGELTDNPHRPTTHPTASAGLAGTEGESDG